MDALHLQFTFVKAYFNVFNTTLASLNSVPSFVLMVKSSCCHSRSYRCWMSSFSISDSRPRGTCRAVHLNPANSQRMPELRFCLASELGGAPAPPASGESTSWKVVPNPSFGLEYGGTYKNSADKLEIGGLGLDSNGFFLENLRYGGPPRDPPSFTQCWAFETDFQLQRVDVPSGSAPDAAPTESVESAGGAGLRHSRLQDGHSERSTPSEVARQPPTTTVAATPPTQTMGSVAPGVSSLPVAGHKRPRASQPAAPGPAAAAAATPSSLVVDLTEESSDKHADGSWERSRDTVDSDLTRDDSEPDE